MGARVLDARRGRRARRGRLRRGRPRRAWRRSGSSCLDLGALAGFDGRRPGPRSCSRRCPPTSTSSPRTRSCSEKLMPVLGLVRSPSRRARHRRLRAGHRARRPRPHVGRLRDRRRRSIDALRRSASAPAASSSTRPTAVGALGGVYNHDDADLLARLRHLGRLDDDRQRQLPQPAQHQDRLAPPDAAAVVPRARPTRTSTPARSRTCATLDCEHAVDRHRRRQRGARRRRRGAPPPGGPAASTSSASVEPEPDEDQVRAGVAMLERPAARPDRRRRRRLGASTPPRRCGSSTSTPS